MINLLEFFDKEVLQIGLIYGNKLYLEKSSKTHLELLERVINLEFITDKTYKDFIKQYNPIYLYFFSNDHIVFSSFERVSLYNLIKILEENNISINHLYQKHGFETLLMYDTFSKINVVKMVNK